MKRNRWIIIFIICLLVTSALTYLAQIAIFHEPRQTFFYMLQDFAFIPIQVLLVTLIVNAVLARREKQELQNKLNMVIGTFFSEMGSALLVYFATFDRDSESLSKLMRISSQWTDRHFIDTKQALQTRHFGIDTNLGNLEDLKKYMMKQRYFILRLLENPNLLEHETFTDLLWAVHHLSEELSFRESLLDLPASDYAHLAGDIQRAYALVLIEWLAYVRHLRDNYPYIYSLVLRTNPFNHEASPVVYG